MRSKPLSKLYAFGLAVRMRRQRIGLSQDALADIAGLHRTYVGGVERGERNVSLLNIHALAGALDITASGLMLAAENKKAPPDFLRSTGSRESRARQKNGAREA